MLELARGPVPARARVPRRIERATMLVAGACAAFVLSGCGRGEPAAASSAPVTAVPDVGRPGAPSAATDSALSVAAADLPADPEHAELLARGEILSFACRPCHGFTPGDESPVGPPLYGMFGRPAASVEAFEYSPALRASGIVWTAETLDAWLAQPEAFLPGNDMDFAGFRAAEDRRALIAYLRKQTAVGATGLPPEGAERTSD